MEPRALPVGLHFPVSWYDEIDGMIVYNDVLVPWERLFSCGDRKFLPAYGGESGYGLYAHCVSMISRMGLLVAAAASLARHNGLWEDAASQQEISDLLVSLEAAKVCLRLSLGPPSVKKLSFIRGYDFKPLFEKIGRVLESAEKGGRVS